MKSANKWGSFTARMFAADLLSSKSPSLSPQHEVRALAAAICKYH